MVELDRLLKVIEPGSLGLELFQDDEGKPHAIKLTQDGTSYSIPVMQVPDDLERVFFDDKSADAPRRVDSDLLAEIQFVLRATSSDETRYYLHGASVCVIESALRLVATDGHRLHAAEVPADWEALTGAIFCRHFLSAVLRAGSGELVLWRNTRGDPFCTVYEARTGSGLLTIQSGLVDGTFPDAARVVPTTFNSDGSWSFPASVDLSKVKKAVGLMGQKSKSLALSGGTPESGAIRWRALDGAGASASGTIAGTAVNARHEFGVNFAYLAEVLASTDAAAILCQQNPCEPMRVDWPDAPRRLAVIMPMRV